jgi:hypothetical protein
MTDTELLDRLEETIREYGGHNFFMVSRTNKLIAVEMEDTTDASVTTDAHDNIRGVIVQLVTRMKETHRGRVH